MNDRIYKNMMATAKGEDKDALLFAILGIRKA